MATAKDINDRLDRVLQVLRASDIGLNSTEIARRFEAEYPDDARVKARRAAGPGRRKSSGVVADPSASSATATSTKRSKGHGKGKGAVDSGAPGKPDPSLKKKIERDLEALILRREVTKETTKGATIWTAKHDDDDEVEALGAAIAFRSILGSIRWMLPASFRNELGDVVARMNQKVQGVEARRWLEALSIEMPHSDFEHPLIDEDVAEAVESAVLKRKSLHIRYTNRQGDEFEEPVTVLKLIVYAPSRPCVFIWPEAVDFSALHHGTWDAYVIPLERIEEAVVLEKDARWPEKGLDFPDLRPTWYLNAADSGHDIWEFRVDPDEDEQWEGLAIKQFLGKPMGIDSEGWPVYRFVNRDRIDILGFLDKRIDRVEILEGVRNFV